MHLLDNELLNKAIFDSSAFLQWTLLLWVSIHQVRSSNQEYNCCFNYPICESLRNLRNSQMVNSGLRWFLASSLGRCNRFFPTVHGQCRHMCMNHRAMHSWEYPLCVTLSMVDISQNQVFRFAFEVYSHFDHFSAFCLQEFLKYVHSCYAPRK